MSINVDTLTDALVSHAATTGYFERVNQHEPKNAPGYGLSCAIWLDRMDLLPSSGLGSSSVRFIFNIRLYSNMVQEPQDQIDPNILKALNALMTAYSGDLTLDGQLRNVDLLGSQGAPLSGVAGYISQDNKMFRVFTINLPLIINDAWDQTA